MGEQTTSLLFWCFGGVWVNVLEQGKSVITVNERSNCATVIVVVGLWQANEEDSSRLSHILPRHF